MSTCSLNQSWVLYISILGSFKTKGFIDRLYNEEILYTKEEEGYGWSDEEEEFQQLPIGIGATKLGPLKCDQAAYGC